VRAVQGGFWLGRPWYFLQTEANMEATDNLLSLPDCPPHAYEVPIFF
jgi:hypothetical protein